MQRQSDLSFTRTLSAEPMDLEKNASVRSVDPMHDDISVIADRLSLEDLFRNSEGTINGGQASDRFSLENNYKTKHVNHSRKINKKQPTARNATMHHAGARRAVVENVQLAEVKHEENPGDNGDVQMVHSVVGQEYIEDLKPESLGSGIGSHTASSGPRGRGDEGQGFRWSWDEIKSLFRRPFSASSRGSSQNNSGRMSLFRWSLDDVKFKFRSLGSSGGRESSRTLKPKPKHRETTGQKPRKPGHVKGKAREKHQPTQERAAAKDSETGAKPGAGKKRGIDDVDASDAPKPSKEHRIRRVKKTQRERQRRDKVSTLFENLGSLVGITPQSANDAIKDPNSSRAAILSSAVDEILKKKGLPPKYSPPGEGLNATPNPRFAEDGGTPKGNVR